MNTIGKDVGKQFKAFESSCEIKSKDALVETVVYC